MTTMLTEAKDWLVAIDNTLKDEAEARALHDRTHVKNIREQRARYEAMLLEQTPRSLSDVASLLIAISDMIDRAERFDLGPAINAIGHRIHREIYPIAL